MSQYAVVETFYSLQGEGVNAGRAFYFIRLAGCHVGCTWCDTKESWHQEKYPQYSADELLAAVLLSQAKSVIITGGEPLLHNLTELCELLQRNHLYTALETSGVGILSGEFNWITLSPKKHKYPASTFPYTKVHELKMVVDTQDDFIFAETMALKVSHHCKLVLQPQWEHSNTITPSIIDYIKSHPQWQFSLQTHKYLQIR